jgi:hypothetical protein
VLEQLDQRVVPDHVRQAADQGRSGPVAACVDDPGPGMGGFETEPQAPIRSPIEDSAQGKEFVNSVWAFTCEDSDGFRIGQPVTRSHRVGCVLAGAVSGAQGHGNAPLGPGTGAVCEAFLGDENGGLAL